MLCVDVRGKKSFYCGDSYGRIGAMFMLEIVGSDL